MTVRQHLPGAALLGAAVAVAIFLRFVALGEPSYWLDEILGQVVMNRAASFPFWRWLTGVHAQHGPLYYATQLAAASVGTTEWLGRLPAALFGVATVPALWIAAHRATADRAAATASAMLLAASPLHVYYSREARPYALLVLLTTLLLLAILRGSRVPAAIIAVLMLYTTVGSATALAAAAGAALIAAFTQRDAGLRRKQFFVAAIAATALAFVPLLYRQAGGEDPPAPFPPLAAGFLDDLIRGLGVTALNSEVAGRAAYVIAALALIGAADLLRRNRDAGFVTVVMCVLPIVISVIALRLNEHFFAMRYVIPALPAYLLLAGAGIAALVRCTGRWSIVPAAIAAALVMSQTWTAARNDSFQKLDWRQIAQTIWNHSKPGDLVIAAEPWSEVSLRHYLMQLPPRVKLVHIFAAEVADVQRRTTRASWLVTAGFTSIPESRNWMCGYPVVLASSLENFRMHFATPEIAGNGTWFYSEGWGNPERDFRWATAERATITIPRWSSRDDVLRMRVLPVAAGQTMRVALNGHAIADLALPHEWTEQSFNAPARLWIDGVNTLTFDFAFVRVPGAADQRALAAAFADIEIGEPFVRLPALIDVKTAWRNTKTNFPPERLDREAVVPLIARLGFHPETVWPMLERGEVRLENLAETVTWGSDCQNDRLFLKNAFAALLARAPAPHEERELLALPRARIPGRMVKWPEFRDAITKP